MTNDKEPNKAEKRVRAFFFNTTTTTNNNHKKVFSLTNLNYSAELSLSSAEEVNGADITVSEQLNSPSHPESHQHTAADVMV